MTTIDGAVYWAVVVSVGNGEKGAAVVRSAALPPEGRGSRTGRSPAVEAKIGLAVASIEHSPAHVDLSGTGLATAIADPEAEAHVRLIAGWLANFASAHTRAAYYGDLVSFARFANTHGLNIVGASKADVAGFKALLEDPDAGDLSPASVARRISAVSSFYRHLEEEGITVGNPALLVRRPRVSEESMTRALTRVEGARLLVFGLDSWRHRAGAA